jgi:hypothetical protein
MSHHQVNLKKYEVEDSSKWFDSECKEAKRLYRNALVIYNNTHRDVDRLELCRLKQNYKNIVKTKQR